MTAGGDNSLCYTRFVPHRGRRGTVDKKMGNLQVPGFAMFGVALAAVASLMADVPLSEQDAASCARKLRAIEQNSLIAAAEPRVTRVSEAEVNSYLKYRAGRQIPTGVLDPYLSIQPGGRITGRATVDLDMVRQQHESTGWLDPMNLLTGKLPVSVSATLTTTNGVARLAIASATVGGVPVPQSLLQGLVSHYTRSPERPEGVRLDAPFELPMRILTIRVESAEAVIVQ